MAEELVLYRDGSALRTVDVGPANREGVFLRAGREVAFYTGGLHFAGRYERVDVDMGKSLESATDPTRAAGHAPGWVRALAR